MGGLLSNAPTGHWEGLKIFIPPINGRSIIKCPDGALGGIKEIFDSYFALLGAIEHRPPMNRWDYGRNYGIMGGIMGL